MSAAKHTPGPWAQHPAYPWIIKQDLQPIADVRDGVTVCSTSAHESSGFFPAPDEGRANARLIAAAPDMLEALQRLSAQCDRLRLVGQSMTDAERNAKAVLAKVTGSES